MAVFTSVINVQNMQIFRCDHWQQWAMSRSEFRMQL